MLASAALVSDDDRPRPGLVLWRPGAAQERAQHHDAQLRADGRGHASCGPLSATAWRSAKGTPFIGDLRYLFLNGVGAAPNADYAATIPQQTYMIYQLMFAIITPALISGAYAERMKFSAMLLFTVLWMLIVYFPLAHMVWGKGGFLNAFLGRENSLLRFRRRHGGAYQLRRLGAGVRAVPGKTARLHDGADEAAQPGDQRDRRLPAVGGLVRIQRGQRRGRIRAGHQRISSLRTFATAAAALGWMVAEWMHERQTQPCWAGSPARWRDWSPSRPPPDS